MKSKLTTQEIIDKFVKPSSERKIIYPSSFDTKLWVIITIVTALCLFVF